jgi:hypothetical protein
MPDEMPSYYEMDPNDERYELRQNLIKALNALPHYFSSPINIEGLAVSDIFAMSALLGGAIEEQTVRILNTLRDTWDPDGRWYDREFVRFSETFPDARLVKSANDPDPVIGIELKGWYLLAKEGVPTFRYQASANAMTEYDLLACFPWALSNVMSGSPVVFEPYIEQAKYVADRRTYYWQHGRKGSNKGRSTEIAFAETTPYPRPGSAYIDVPAKDSGNFGRIARVGVMDKYIADTMETKLAGIEARYWIGFFAAFAESKTRAEIEHNLRLLEMRIREERSGVSDDARMEIMEHVVALLELV